MYSSILNIPWEMGGHVSAVLAAEIMALQINWEANITWSTCLPGTGKIRETSSLTVVPSIIPS
jgi:hypothetical protein